MNLELMDLRKLIVVISDMAHRMTSYIYQAKPKSMEEVVDEMLAIRSEIETWRVKKDSENANAKYNEMLYYGLGNNEED